MVSLTSATTTAAPDDNKKKEPQPVKLKQDDGGGSMPPATFPMILYEVLLLGNSALSNTLNNAPFALKNTISHTIYALPASSDTRTLHDVSTRRWRTRTHHCSFGLSEAGIFLVIIFFNCRLRCKLSQYLHYWTATYYPSDIYCKCRFEIVSD